MEPSETNHHKRILHSKRSFGKAPGHKIDSPAYDASVFYTSSPSLPPSLPPRLQTFSSEEDNDPLTDDGSPALPAHPSLRQSAASQHRGQQTLTARPGSPPLRSRLKHTLSPYVVSDDGVDSPTYDGDIESSTTVGRDRDHPSPVQPNSAVTSTLPSPTPLIQHLPAVVTIIPSPSTASSSDVEMVSVRAHDASPAFTPSTLAPEDIQAFVHRAISGEIHRKFKINDPPTGRPVRIYADGTFLLRLLHLLSLTRLLHSKACTTFSTLGRS
jgi:choline-phosphate cytidylyltransferase